MPLNGLGASAAEAIRARNNKRKTTPVPLSPDLSWGAGLLVDVGDKKSQAVSEGEDGDTMDKALKDNHDFAFRPTTIDPQDLSREGDQGGVEGLSRLWTAEKREGHEMECLPEGLQGVNPYRNIENVFLPLPTETQAMHRFAAYLRRNHGRRPQASASRLQPIITQPSISQHDHLDGTSDEEEFKKDLIDEIEQMMYVSGETGEPSAETTGMIEEIVRQQVVEIVSTP